MACLGEGGIDRGLVTEMPLKDRVVRRICVDLRLAGLLRGREIDDGSEHIVIDVDELGCVVSLIERFGDDDGDMIADIAHLIERERGMRTRLHGRSVLGVDHPAADQPADLVRDESACR